MVEKWLMKLNNVNSFKLYFVQSIFLQIRTVAFHMSTLKAHGIDGLVCNWIEAWLAKEEYVTHRLAQPQQP